jgi:hypothetical protein
MRDIGARGVHFDDPMMPDDIYDNSQVRKGGPKLFWRRREINLRADGSR